MSNKEQQAISQRSVVRNNWLENHVDEAFAAVSDYVLKNHGSDSELQGKLRAGNAFLHELVDLLPYSEKKKLIELAKQAQEGGGEEQFYSLPVLGGFVESERAKTKDLQKWTQKGEVDAKRLRKSRLRRRYPEVDYQTDAYQQARPEQGVTELVANCVDAYTNNAIGRFGKGSLSNIAWLRAKKDRFEVVSSTDKEAVGASIRALGDDLFISTKKKGVFETRATSVLGEFGETSTDLKTGTLASIRTQLSKAEQQSLFGEVRFRFEATEGVRVLVKMDEEVHEINNVDGLVEVSGKAIEKDVAKTVYVTISDHGYQVLDLAEGFGTSVLYRKYLVPGRSGKRFAKSRSGETLLYSQTNSQEPNNDSPRVALRLSNTNIEQIRLSRTRILPSNFSVICFPAYLGVDESRTKITKDKTFSDSIHSLMDRIDRVENLSHRISHYNVVAETLRAIANEGGKRSAEHDLFQILTQGIKSRLEPAISELKSQGKTMLPNLKPFEHLLKSEVVYVDESLFDFEPGNVAYLASNWESTSINQVWVASFKDREGVYRPMHLIFGDIILIDSGMFEGLSKTEEGVALLNLLVQEVNSSYHSPAKGMGTQGEFVGEFKTVLSPSTNTTEAVSAREPQTLSSEESKPKSEVEQKWDQELNYVDALNIIIGEHPFREQRKELVDVITKKRMYQARLSEYADLLLQTKPEWYSEYYYPLLVRCFTREGACEFGESAQAAIRAIDATQEFFLAEFNKGEFRKKDVHDRSNKPDGYALYRVVGAIESLMQDDRLDLKNGDVRLVLERALEFLELAANKYELGDRHTGEVLGTCFYFLSRDDIDFSDSWIQEKYHQFLSLALSIEDRTFRSTQMQVCGAAIRQLDLVDANDFCRTTAELLYSQINSQLEYQESSGAQESDEDRKSREYRVDRVRKEALESLGILLSRLNLTSTGSWGQGKAEEIMGLMEKMTSGEQGQDYMYYAVEGCKSILDNPTFNYQERFSTNSLDRLFDLTSKFVACDVEHRNSFCCVLDFYAAFISKSPWTEADEWSRKKVEQMLGNASLIADDTEGRWTPLHINVSRVCEAYLGNQKLDVEEAWSYSKMQEVLALYKLSSDKVKADGRGVYSGGGDPFFVGGEHTLGAFLGNPGLDFSNSSVRSQADWAFGQLLHGLSDQHEVGGLFTHQVIRFVENPTLDFSDPWVQSKIQTSFHAMRVLSEKGDSMSRRNVDDLRLTAIRNLMARDDFPAGERWTLDIVDDALVTLDDISQHLESRDYGKYAIKKYEAKIAGWLNKSKLRKVKLSTVDSARLDRLGFSQVEASRAYAVQGYYFPDVYPIPEETFAKDGFKKSLAQLRNACDLDDVVYLRNISRAKRQNASDLLSFASNSIVGQALVYRGVYAEDERVGFEAHRERLESLPPVGFVEVIDLYVMARNGSTDAKDVVENLLVFFESTEEGMVQMRRKLLEEIDSLRSQEISGLSPQANRILQFLSTKRDFLPKTEQIELDTTHPYVGTKVSKMITRRKHGKPILDKSETVSGDTESVTKVAHSQSPRQDVFVRELLQNARDAIAEVADGQIEIRIVNEDGSCILEVSDVGGKGMDWNILSEYFFQPNRSGKRQEAESEGEIGWGAFSYYPPAEDVDILTTRDGRQIHCRVRPERKHDLVDDVEIVGSNEATKVEGSGSTFRIKLLKSDLGPEWQALWLANAVDLYAKPLAESANVAYQGERVKSGRESVAGTVPYKSGGSLTVSLTYFQEDGWQRITRRSMFISTTDDDRLDVLKYVHPTLKSIIKSRGLGVQIDIPHSIPVTRVRGGLAVPVIDLERLRKTTAAVVLQEVAKRYRKGEWGVDLLPDDLLYDGHFRADQELVAVVKKVNRALKGEVNVLDAVNFDQLVGDSIYHLQHVIDGITQADGHSISDVRKELLRSLRANEDPAFKLGISDTVRMAAASNVAAKQARDHMVTLGKAVYKEGAYPEHLRYFRKLINEQIGFNQLEVNMAEAPATVWGGNSVGLPVGGLVNSPSDEWGQSFYAQALDLGVHEAVHWAEQAVFHSNNSTSLSKMIPLLDHLKIEPALVKKLKAGEITQPEIKTLSAALRRAVMMPEEEGVYVPTHSESERTPFGFMYKRLAEIVALKMVDN